MWMSCNAAIRPRHVWYGLVIEVTEVAFRMSNHERCHHTRSALGGEPHILAARNVPFRHTAKTKLERRLAGSVEHSYLSNYFHPFSIRKWSKLSGSRITHRPEKKRPFVMLREMKMLDA
jgi:hypothetical protein